MFLHFVDSIDCIIYFLFISYISFGWFKYHIDYILYTSRKYSYWSFLENIMFDHPLNVKSDCKAFTIKLSNATNTKKLLRLLVRTLFTCIYQVVRTKCLSFTETSFTTMHLYTNMKPNLCLIEQNGSYVVENVHPLFPYKTKETFRTT